MSMCLSSGDVLVGAVKESDTISDGGNKELGRGKRHKQAN